MAPVAIALPTSASPYANGLLCVDATYQAPPEVDTGLYRYVALGSGAASCDEGAHNAVSAVTAGFAVVHTKGLHHEFSADGQLLAVVDSSGPVAAGVRGHVDCQPRRHTGPADQPGQSEQGL